MALGKGPVYVDVQLVLFVETNNDVDPLLERDTLDSHFVVDFVEGVHHHKKVVCVGCDVESRCVIRLAHPKTRIGLGEIHVGITLAEYVLVFFAFVVEVIDVNSDNALI